MDSTPFITYNAIDRSYFALMKKEIHALAEQNGFSSKKTGEIDIIVAEMASNLIKYAGGGEILVRMCDQGGVLEIISIDNGPGMDDLQKMMADGFSSTNTLGHGLGSINRLSDLFQAYSLKGWGTILLSRVYKNRQSDPKKKGLAEIRQLLVCKPGEEVCGDGITASILPKEVRLFHGDGLGHGKDAHLAVTEAIKAFNSMAESDPVEILREISRTVKRTRGLVASVAIYNSKEKTWSICGIGNISTRILNSMFARNYVAYNGIVGLNVPNTMKSLQIEYEGGQVLVMCSDGIKTRWDLQKYPSILKCDLSILASAIYKDHARRTDDMSIVVCRLNHNNV